MTTSINGSSRTIGWNTITLKCPTQWEPIVTKPTHLLFEENFRPVLELRWQNGKRHHKRSNAATLHKIAAETGLTVLEELPPHWEKLQKKYALTLLADNDSGEPKAAIMICKECGTTLLLYFFDIPATKNHQCLTEIIESIHCHRQNKSDWILWEIQDFKILLPGSFSLSGYNFGAGLTRLSFADSGLTMHLCRLAGASQRLEKSSMLTIMNILGELDISEEDAQHMEGNVSHCSFPSILQQIRNRIKRKLPFHWVTLRHHPEHDRLSGLFFFDKKPIPNRLITTILKSYEIQSL
ncbi:hypothetical protein UWK_01863 [Desulfocapsa sulfexigens DSM 10523]|uniref:Uncharacterized protein n=1 Tax=Desulfocapsa sulfexigens (strain DSM 10523 / SB164P1) TaxID=1167006 RepID=M1PFH1_DESSD|nr:hypothetical protein [Desulfocapsa sulfexigens]AGF78420.1 hypothetical protein UWK_01863 [Desulfocapsa sulfexigens DSM 10523]